MKLVPLDRVYDKNHERVSVTPRHLVEKQPRRQEDLVSSSCNICMLYYTKFRVLNNNVCTFNLQTNYRRENIPILTDTKTTIKILRSNQVSFKLEIDLVN